MNTPNNDVHASSNRVSPRWAPIPVAQLVHEVYASSAPEAQQQLVARLVGKVYESAPAPIKTRLLEHLLRPLGLLSLLAIANGIFARIGFDGGWPQPALHPGDVKEVRASDVVALAEFALQVSGEAANGLVHLLTTSPALAGSGAATVLASILLQRTQNRRASDRVH